VIHQSTKRLVGIHQLVEACVAAIGGVSNAMRSCTLADRVDVGDCAPFWRLGVVQVRFQ
jgi:hypothetical protein